MSCEIYVSNSSVYFTGPVIAINSINLYGASAPLTFAPSQHPTFCSFSPSISSPNPQQTTHNQRRRSRFHPFDLSPFRIPHSEFDLPSHHLIFSSSILSHLLTFHLHTINLINGRASAANLLTFPPSHLPSFRLFLHSMSKNCRQTMSKVLISD